MLQANSSSIPAETPAKSGESATEILARIWPEYDPNGYGIMAEMMEKVLRQVEQEQGTSLLKQSSWEELGDYIARVEGTVVSQKDLSDLLSLLQGTPPPPLPTVETFMDEQDQGSFREEVSEDLQQQQHNRSDEYYQLERRPVSERDHLLHPRHHSSAHLSRPRSSSIRKISLSESSSSQFRPRHSRASHGSSSGEESDESEHLMTSSGHGSHSGISSSSSSPSPTVGDSKEWRSNYNNMSIREQSRTEYEGYGLDADYDSQENMESVQQAYLTLQRKLKETERELEYQARANEQAREAMMNQQETEDLKRDLKAMKREISEFKKNEQFKSSQIAELTQQIEKSEKTNSSQKSTAAAWKKQKEELEEENARVRESLRQSEVSLNQLSKRLASDEAGRRRINADSQAIDELRERLAQEVAKGQAMARQLELANNEKLRLTELNGNLKNEVENLAGASNLSLNHGSGGAGRTLMSELASVDPKFGPGYDHEDEDLSLSSKHHFDTTSSERARRLLQESTSLNLKLKRTSMRDLSQRFKESGLESALKNEIKEPSQYTPISTTNQQQEEKEESKEAHEGDNQATSVVKHRADDVDCALPPEVQILEAKEAMLDQNLGSQAELIDSLLKFREATQPIEPTTSFGADGIIRQNATLANFQKTERARRRKPHQSKILSQADVIDLLNPGARSASAAAPTTAGPSGSATTAIRKKESKRVIANVTLMSMYTIVGYVLGLVTSVFLVDNAQPGGFNYGRFLSYDAFQGEAVNAVDGGGRFKVIEILVYWIQNLVWQADAGYVPT
ncbi:hypothetical protein BGX26_007453 [Mortierella sp. AD094]|nr:hypothetical protein BGX26_007453 [Mortierella sp. AD094]